MKMTSFELLKDLDITSVAISHICFKNELFFPSSKKMRDSLRFYAMLFYLPNGSPQGGHPYLAGVFDNKSQLNEWNEVNLFSMSR